uniref:Transcriptional regulator, XRE family n=1 Tax=Chlorobium chlorochromatii (strain CaD3) TaxID=340177 RepID=Q3APL3_CHLCH
MKNKSKTYQSEAFAAIHETASGMYDVGVIDKQTMREFDEVCLTPIHHVTPSDIKALREREEVSQSVFARYLNVSKDVVSQWERGAKKPAGTTLKLLALVERKGIRTIA